MLRASGTPKNWCDSGGQRKPCLSIRRSLTGVFADDPKLLLGYAHAQFAAGDAAAARGTLDELIRKNPGLQIGGRTPAVRIVTRGRREPGQGAVRVRDACRVLPGRRGRRALRQTAQADRASDRRRARCSRICWNAPSTRLRTIARRSGIGSTRLKKSCGAANQRNGAADLQNAAAAPVNNYFLRLMERNETPSIMALYRTAPGERPSFCAATARRHSHLGELAQLLHVGLRPFAHVPSTFFPGCHSGVLSIRGLEFQPVV